MGVVGGAPPCAEGWSRGDPLSVSPAGEGCHVLEASVTAAAWCVVVTSAIAVSLEVLAMRRLTASGHTTDPIFGLRMSFAVSVAMLGASLGAPALLGPGFSAVRGGVWSQALLFVGTWVQVRSGVVLMGHVWLESAVDQLFVLRPAQGERVRARIAWLVEPIAFLHGMPILAAFADLASSPHEQHDRSLRTIFGCVACYFFLGCATALAASRVSERAQQQLHGEGLGHQEVDLQLAEAMRLFASTARRLALACAVWFFGGALPVLASRRMRRVAGVWLMLLLCLSWWVVIASHQVCCNDGSGNDGSGGGGGAAVAPERAADEVLTLPTSSKQQFQQQRAEMALLGAIERAAGAKPSFRLSLRRQRPRGMPVYCRGVSLAFLRKWVAEKGLGGGSSMTTMDVCHTLVKPLTAARRCSYFELLSASPQGAVFVGKANYFLSHAWSYCFPELIGILEAFEAQQQLRDTCSPGGPPQPQKQAIFYWFDIFVMNQHNSEEVGRDLQANLRKAVSSSGKLLLALDSWSHPLPLMRVWCLLEIFTALQEGATVTMCMSETMAMLFRLELADNQEVIGSVIDTIDVAEASATVEADKLAIFELVRKGCGFERFNEEIRAALRASLKRIVLRAMMNRRNSVGRSSGRGTLQRRLSLTDVNFGKSGRGALQLLSPSFGSSFTDRRHSKPG